MFTGIIENFGVLKSIQKNNTNLSFEFESNLSSELKVDQSLSHNGVCLTVEKIDIAKKQYQVTAIDETLKKTNLGNLQIGDQVNLERCMKADGRFDGHIVQGHVDQTGECINIEDKNGSYEITIGYDSNSKNITIEKGSICLNGISLTVYDSKISQFKVSIIPYTWENTNLKHLKIGDYVNLEFDIVGKYLQKMANPILHQN